MPQVLVNYFVDLYSLAMAAYANQSLSSLQAIQAVMMRVSSWHPSRHRHLTPAQTIADLDAVLSTDSNYLLGTWLERATQLAGPGEETLFLFNARNQITLWGWEGEIVDYASKHWAGVVLDYYGTARWVCRARERRERQGETER
jgi:hypothetical protein